MKKIRLGILSVALAITGAVFFRTTAVAQEGKAGLNLPVGELKWEEAWKGTGIYVAQAWGDRLKTAHGTFMKLPAGMVSDKHTHTNDVKGVVISGTVSHVVDGGMPEEKPLAPGSYWFTPGGVKHVTKCAPGADCVFLLVMDAPHDFLPVADPNAPKTKENKKK